MQNLKQKTKPVQIDADFHKALKTYSASKGQEMKDVLHEILQLDPAFRLALEKVKAL